MVSGGPNGGPQYNPANVSGVGGAGQSGDYTGFAYGKNKAINQDIVEGNQAVASVKASNPSATGGYSGISMPQLGTLMDPTNNPAEIISAGVDGTSRGGGSEMLPANFQNNTRIDENAKIAMDYLPDLAYAARSADAPDSFKRFVNYLIENSQGMKPV